MAWGTEAGFGGFSGQQQALSVCARMSISNFAKPEALNSNIKRSNLSDTYCKMGTVHLLPLVQRGSTTSSRPQSLLRGDWLC